MAATQMWKCQLCESRYALLFELVVHVRAAHSSDYNLNFVCQVKGCPRIFKKTNTWYKHVRSQHMEEYFTREVLIAENPQSDDEEMENFTGDDGGEEPDPPTNPSCPNSCTSNIISPDAAAGMLLKLKEKYKLSHAAVDEVIQVFGIMTDHVVTKTLSAVEQSAEAHGMDLTSPFFENLPKIAEDVSNPFSALETAYRQQTYVSKNFPYVVSLISCLYCMCTCRPLPTNQSFYR